MKYLEILRSPFQLDQVEEMDIKNSLITLGISAGIFGLNLMLLAVLALDSLGEYIGIGGFYGASYISDMGGALSWRLLIAGGIGFSIGALVLTGIVFLIKKIQYAEYKFEMALSLVGQVLVLPVAVLPMMLIGALLITSVVGVYISICTIVVSVVILGLNLIDALTEINPIGKGKSIYISSLGIVIYNGLTLYVTYKVLVGMLASLVKSTLY